MNKQITTCSLLTLTAVGLAMGGQSELLSKQATKQPVMPENAVVMTTGNTNQVTQNNSGPFQVNYNSPGVVIGNGFYDYQANGAIGKRMVIDDSGNYHLTFISANIYTSDPGTNTTRGSFYSFSNDGVNWGLDDGTGTGTISPTWTRIENARGGFPAIDYFRNTSINGVGGAAALVSHYNDPSLNGAVHSVGSIDLFPGQGLWEHPEFPLVPGLPAGDDQPIWPVCTVGNNDVVHAVGSVAPADQATSPLAAYYASLSNPFAQQFSPMQAMANFPGVYIVPDGGAKAFVSDGADHILLLFFNASGSAFQDTTVGSNALYKFESMDNGATWAFDNVTEDTPLNFNPSTNVEDFEWRSWQHFDASFDAQGDLHYVYTEHKSTSSGSYFPNAFRLMYKNTTGTETQIFAYNDHESGNELVGSVFEDGTSWNNPTIAPSGADLGGAFQQIVGTPMLGFDTNGDMHVIFEGFPLGDVDWANMPNGDSASAMTHGDVWHTMSTDGGSSWGFGSEIAGSLTQIENITNSLGTDERYPMCPPMGMTAGKVAVSFQTDDVAGSYSYNGTGALSAVPGDGTDYMFYEHDNGTGTVYDIALVTSSEENSNEVAKGYELAQNFPNPFNPTTNIEFSVEGINNVKVEIFNIKGQLVKTLFEGTVSGSKSVQWDATDLSGNVVSSGTYFYSITGPNFNETKKMTFLK
ncbi:MAG: T9SS C-terminal target domain-containing protein [Calditrichaeota bacterium]|nr:MAG: T9SS C-terminal target domain-containing protein [Calditrichota bacterium]